MTAREPPEFAGRAFGLGVHATAPVIGLNPSRSGAAGATRIALVDRAELDRLWPPGVAEVLNPARTPDGEPQVGIRRRPGAGYCVTYPRWGRYLISEDGSRISCAPPRVRPWRWQRLLTGQLLPIASVLQGLEALHASVVRIGDRGVAFSAPSGVGKTSLAVQLLLRGAGFVADDVAAIEPVGGTLRVHPGVRCINLALNEYRKLGAARRHDLGAAVGHGGDAARFVVKRSAGEIPLHGLYFLRRTRRGRYVRIEQAEPTPALVFSAVYNHLLRAPDRLRAQLDLLARLARTTPVFTLEVPPAVHAEGVAAAVERHVQAELAGASR